jgi:hypothetical protein
MYFSFLFKFNQIILTFIGTAKNLTDAQKRCRSKFIASMTPEFVLDATNAFNEALKTDLKQYSYPEMRKQYKALLTENFLGDPQQPILTQDLKEVLADLDVELDNINSIIQDGETILFTKEI